MTRKGPTKKERTGFGELSRAKYLRNNKRKMMAY